MSTYVCPMYADVRVAAGGRCPHCGMNLVPEGASFAFMRHMFGSPLHIAIMIAVMLLVMGR